MRSWQCHQCLKRPGSGIPLYLSKRKNISLKNTLADVVGSARRDVFTMEFYCRGWRGRSVLYLGFTGPSNNLFHLAQNVF